MKISGKKLKTILRAKDVTQESAAKSLGMTRQALSLLLKQEVLGDDVIQNVRDKLDINLGENDVEMSSGILSEPEAAPYNKKIESLERLAALKEKRYLTEDEYQKLKSEIINKP